MKRKVYQKIASTVVARLCCMRGSWKEEWVGRHEEVLSSINQNHLPSGSGFDLGTRINFSKSTGEKLVLDSAIHHMDEGGYYDGWTHFSVIVKPSLVHEITIQIVGRFPRKYDDKDFIHNVFLEALMKEVEDI